MTEATRRLNQLEVGLERIQDPVVREALTGLLEYVRTIQGSGVSTRGKVTASSGFFVGNFFAADKDGNVDAASFQTDGGGRFKTKYFQGELAPEGSVTLALPGHEVIGAVGMVSSSATTWRLLQATFSPTTISASASGGHAVLLSNGSESDSRLYRVLVFYKDKMP